jgi:hypothetical protein
VPELKELLRFYEAHKNETFVTRASMDNLVLYIGFMSRLFGDVFLVIDGLDECGNKDRKMIIAAIKTVQEGTTNSHSLVVSRREVDIAEALSQEANLAMDKGLVLTDIETHIITRFTTDTQLRCRNPVVQLKIKDALLEKCGGM